MFDGAKAVAELGALVSLAGLALGVVSWFSWRLIDKDGWIDQLVGAAVAFMQHIRDATDKLLKCQQEAVDAHVPHFTLAMKHDLDAGHLRDSLSHAIDAALLVCERTGTNGEIKASLRQAREKLQEADA